MPMTEETLEGLIRDGFPDAEVKITDLAGDNDHYAVHIVSEKFIGKSRVQQHKMVHEALKGSMDSELHALAIQTATPEN